MQTNSKLVVVVNNVKAVSNTTPYLEGRVKRHTLFTLTQCSAGADMRSPQSITGSIKVTDVLSNAKLTRPDGIDGVGHQARGDGDGPAEKEGESHACISPEDEGLQRVVEAEVHPPVDEDAHGGDDEAAVQALDPVGLQGLDVHVHQPVELPLASLALGIVSKPDNLGIGYRVLVRKTMKFTTAKCNGVKR